MSHARFAVFDDIKFDMLKGVLINSDGEELPLEPKIQAFLTLLVESNGEVIERQQILQALWDDPDKADERLRALVKKTREALNDNAKSPKFIKTIPKKGYRFLLPVIFETESEQSKASSFPVGRWLSAVAGCFLVVVMFFAVPHFQPTEDIASHTTWTIIEEQTQEIDHGLRAYHIADNTLFTITNDDEIVSASWYAERQLDMRIELNDKQLLFEGLSLNKQDAYIVTQKNNSVEFTHWALDDDKNPALNTINLTRTPAHFLAFDSDRGSIYFNAGSESGSQIIKMNMTEPVHSEVLVDNLSNDIDGFHISKTLEKVLHFDNDLVSSTLTIIDVKSNQSVSKEFNFPIEKIIDSDVQESVLLLDEDKRIFGLNFETDHLTLWQTPLQKSDQLIGVCGYDCVLVHRAANKFDIYAHPLMDIDDDQLTTVIPLGTSSVVSSMIAANNEVIISSYTPGGIDVTTIKENQQVLAAQLKSLQSAQHLVSNRTNSLIAGSEADRIFTLNPLSGEFRWLDIPMSKTGFPQFDLFNDDIVYFTSLDPRFDTSVFKYSLSSDTYERVATKALLHLPMS
ncbi:MAG: helix-turn-helix domain-containing protein, partial [Pseudomonadota bacterium]